MLGALLEAVESHAAEQYDADGPVAAFDDLDPSTRPQGLDDFARDRRSSIARDTVVRWSRAKRPDGRELLVPFEAVSLDFTIAKDSIFERASAGVATGSTEEEARNAALLELIERDAVSRFRHSDEFARLEREMDPASVTDDWFVELFARLRALALDLRLFAPPSPTGIPVFMAAIVDRSKGARPYAGTVGHAAHPLRDVALFQAVAEALQSRLTFISGAREDCWPDDYTRPTTGVVAALAPPPVPGIDAFDPQTIGDRTDIALAEALLSMGCKDLAFVSLARLHGFHVVRAFAPGLGSLAKEPRL